MKIQKLEPSQHRQGRWLVWLEDGSLLRVSEGDVVSLSLYTGKELSGEEAASLTETAGQSKLNERAVALLSARAMSRKELVDKLSTPVRRGRKAGETLPEKDPDILAREKEQLAEQAQCTADRMERMGLLNDRDYASAVVRHYEGKGFGVRRIKEELYRRGVPREYWEEALSECSGSERALDKLVGQKLRGAELTRENLKKTSDYLARRGYGWEEISAALRRYGAEDGEPT